jgi:hypothetical protein
MSSFIKLICSAIVLFASASLQASCGCPSDGHGAPKPPGQGTAQSSNSTPSTSGPVIFSRSILEAIEENVSAWLLPIDES